MPMNREYKIGLTILLSVIILLSPLIAGWIMNIFTVYETYTAYYLVTRTDFSLAIKIVSVLSIIKINQNHD